LKIKNQSSSVPLIPLSSTFSQEHLILDVKIQSDSVDHRTYAMIDSGAMSSFIDISFAKSLKLPVRKKNSPVHVVAVDGRPLCMVLLLLSACSL